MKNIESNKYENNSSNYQSRNQYSANFVGKNKNEIKLQSTPPSENIQTPEAIKKDDKKKTSNTKSKEVSQIVTKLVTVVSAAVIGVASVEALSPFSTDYEVFMDDCYATQNEINYNIYIENKNNKIDDTQHGDIEFIDEFTVVLYNDFTNREKKFEGYYAEGVFEDLQTNMTYTLAVKIGNKTIATKTLKTYTRTSDGSNDPYTDPDKPTENNTGQNTDPTNNNP